VARPWHGVAWAASVGRVGTPLTRFEMGAPTPGDKQIVDQSMAAVMTALQ